MTLDMQDSYPYPVPYPCHRDTYPDTEVCTTCTHGPGLGPVPVTLDMQDSYPYPVPIPMSLYPYLYQGPFPAQIKKWVGEVEAQCLIKIGKRKKSVGLKIKLK